MSKKKKEKITYLDDGRTIADMSGVSGGFSFGERNPYKPPASLKEIWKTYWAAVKMMLPPMLVVIAGIVAIYLIITFLFWLQY